MMKNIISIAEIPLSKNLNKAIKYAMKMHEGQQRLDGSPYINHPLGVLKKVHQYKKSDNLDTLLISACLHDVLEDTEATYYDIVKIFGPQVAGIVLELTTDEDLKREIGKTKYLEIKMKNMSSWALVIKLCDRLDNVSDLLRCNETFRNKYIKETIEILQYLLENRNLTKTHLNIIKSIIQTLIQTSKLSNLNIYQENLENINMKVRKLIPKENIPLS